MFGEVVNEPNETNRIELSGLFESTQKKMVAEFSAIREAIDHGGTLGDETEKAWRDFIGQLLPTRYQVCDGFVVDAQGLRSDQMDIIVFDRHYSPPLFQAGNVQYVPAEAVYAVFEVKQRIDRKNLRQACAKVSSVRRLARTTAPIPTADGVVEPKPLHRVLGGLLALSFGKMDSVENVVGGLMTQVAAEQRLDLGCAIRDGSFNVNYDPAGVATVSLGPSSSSLVAFFFQLLSMLQRIGTVPAIEYDKYLKAVADPKLRPGAGDAA